MMHSDDNVGTYEDGTNYNNSLMADKDGNYYKQQFVIQVQAVF